MQQNKTTIEQLRQKIDSIDDRIVSLLNERAQVVLEVGRLKSGSNMEFHVPGRERQIYERLLGANSGRFPTMHCVRSIVKLFRPALRLSRP